MILFCECPDWAPNIAKVNGPMITMALRRGSEVAYDGVPFRYCPWCGNGLKESVELRKRTDRAMRDKEPDFFAPDLRKS